MKEKIFHLGIKALIQNKSGEILLLKVNQEKFKNPSPRDYWDIPGGRILNGHTTEETLLREIKEETGITTIDSFKPLDTLISNIEIPLNDQLTAGLILSIYYCVMADQTNIKLSSEHTEYAWVFPEEASLLLSYKYPTTFTEKVRNLPKSKLVRDHIPRMITKLYGEEPNHYIADEIEYEERLRHKLLEETQEFLKTKNPNEALEELADIVEVIESLSTQYNLTLNDVLEAKSKKAKERGRFQNRVVLTESKYTKSS